MDRGLLQREAAEEIGVTTSTLGNWETGFVTDPEVRHLPAILSFLGYDPRAEPSTFGGRIRAKREALGLTHRTLAARLGLDPSTVQVWEADAVKVPLARMRAIFEDLLREE